MGSVRERICKEPDQVHVCLFELLLGREAKAAHVVDIDGVGGIRAPVQENIQNFSRWQCVSPSDA